MSAPLIYVGTYTIKPGNQEDAPKRCAELVDFVETNEPRMIAFHAYLGPDGNTLSIIQQGVIMKRHGVPIELWGNLRTLLPGSKEKGSPAE